MPGFPRLRIPRPSDSSEDGTGPCCVSEFDSDSDYTPDQSPEVSSSDDEGIHILPSETQLARGLGKEAVRPTRAELPIWQSEGQALGFPPQRRPLRRPSAHMRPYLPPALKSWRSIRFPACVAALGVAAFLPPPLLLVTTQKLSQYVIYRRLHSRRPPHCSRPAPRPHNPACHCVYSVHTLIAMGASAKRLLGL